MSQTGARLVAHVIPQVPVRQSVLSLPIPLRLLLAAQPELVTPALGVVQRVLGRSWLAEADADGDEARTLRPLQAAAVTYRNCLRTARRPKGSDAARRDAARGHCAPATVCRR
jgi:hypothetical protein